MMHKRLLCPARRRRVPSQFSWVDHRLVREHHLEGLPVEAMALYLFLVTVGDADGLSYYGEASITRYLPLDQPTLELARRALLAADLIAFEPPLYQVLSLDAGPPTPLAPPPPRARDDAATRQAGARHLAEILRDLGVPR